MATAASSSSSSSSSSFSRHFPTWQDEYETVLRLVKTFGSLFQCAQVAESAILIRREALRKGSNHEAEREAIDQALVNLKLIKAQLLRFGAASSPDEAGAGSRAGIEDQTTLLH